MDVERTVHRAAEALVDFRGGESLIAVESTEALEPADETKRRAQGNRDAPA